MAGGRASTQMCLHLFSQPRRDSWADLDRTLLEQDSVGCAQTAADRNGAIAYQAVDVVRLRSGPAARSVLGAAAVCNVTRKLHKSCCRPVSQLWSGKPPCNRGVTVACT